LNGLTKTRDPDSREFEIIKTAERELAAYLNAVTEFFGTKQAQLAAKDWLQELEITNTLPAGPREWRVITIDSARRLATRLNAPKQKEV
jgi:hypothetical protein